MAKFQFSGVYQTRRIHYPQTKKEFTYEELFSLEQGALQENLAIIIKKNLKELDNESGCSKGN